MAVPGSSIFLYAGPKVVSDDHFEILTLVATYPVHIEGSKIVLSFQFNEEMKASDSSVFRMRLCPTKVLCDNEDQLVPLGILTYYGRRLLVYQ